MFRAHRAHHQERQIVSIQRLVTVILCWWPRCVQVRRRITLHDARSTTCKNLGKSVVRMGILDDLEACSVDCSGISTSEPVDIIGLIIWLGNWLANHFVSDGGIGIKVNTITSSHNFLVGAGAHAEA